MKATTLLLSHHHRIQNLIESAAKDLEAREEQTLALLQAVSWQIATEERVLYPVVERELALDTSSHRKAHVRARLALFRLATTSASAFDEHLAGLDRVLRAHALAESEIVRALEDRMSEAGLIRLGQRMNEFRDEALVA